MGLVEKKKNLYLLSIFMSMLYQIFQMCPLFQGSVIDVDNGMHWLYWLLYQHHLLWKVLLFLLFYLSSNPPCLIWALILVLELETLFGTSFFFSAWSPGQLPRQASIQLLLCHHYVWLRTGTHVVQDLVKGSERDGTSG